MERDYVGEFESGLIGRTGTLKRIAYDVESPGTKHYWDLGLDGGWQVSIPVPWRIIADGRIRLGSEDDGQMFGLKEPLNGQARAQELLEGKQITKAVLDRVTADLTLTFDHLTRMDIFNPSAGYEGWYGGSPEMSVVALGGGDVTVVVRP